MPQVKFVFTALGGEAIVHLFEQIGVTAQLTQKRLEAGTPAMRAVDAAVRDISKSAKGLAAELGPLGPAFAALGVGGLAAGAALGGLGLFLRGAVHDSAAFGQALADLSAVTGATGADLTGLRDRALELSAASTESALNILKGFEEIARSNPALRENAEALAEVTRQAVILAGATGTDLAAAAHAVTTELTQFGGGVEEAGRVANVLAAASRRGRADLGSLAEALGKSGAVAHLSGISIEEYAAAIEVLTRADIPAERSGVLLSRMFVTLARGARDTNPAVVGLATALDNLAKKQLSLGELSDLFGVRAAGLVTTVLAQRDAIRRLTEEVTDTTEAQDLWQTKTDTLEGSLKKLSNAWHAMAGAIFESKGLLRDFIDLTTQAIQLVPKGPILAQGAAALARSTLSSPVPPEQSLALIEHRLDALREKQLATPPTATADQVRALEADRDRLAALVRRQRDQAAVISASIGPPTELVGPPAPFIAPHAAIESAAAGFEEVRRRLATDAAGKIGKIRAQETEDIAKIDLAELLHAKTTKEAQDQRIKAHAQAATEIAKIEKSGVDTRRAFLEQTIALEGAAAAAALTGVKKVEAERDAAFAKLAEQAKTEGVTAEDVARRRVAIEADAAAKVATLRQQSDDVVRKAQEAAAVAPLTGVARAQKEAQAATEETLRAFEKQFKGEDDLATKSAALRVSLEQEAAAKIGEAQKQEAENFLAPFRGAAHAIETQLTDAFASAFEGGKGAAFDFGKAVEKILARLAAEIALLFIKQGVLLPIFNALVGGGPATQSGGGNIVAGIASLLGGGGAVNSAVNLGGGLAGGGQQPGFLARVFGFGGQTTSALGGTTANVGVNGLAAPAVANAGTSFNTFGVPTLAQRLFGDRLANLLGFGGTAVQGIAAGTGPLGSAVAANGGFFIPGITQAAGSGVLLPGSALNAGGQVVAAGEAPAAGAATSGLSTLAGYAGLAISLGLAAKGLVDSRAAFDKVTLGTAGGTNNALTAAGAGFVVGGTAAGAAIGTAVEPGIGTVVGAGIGAAVGSAIATAISSAVTSGVAGSVNKGLNQAGLQAAVLSKLQHDPLLTILSGGSSQLGGGYEPLTNLFALLFTPSIERIFAKEFRGVLGGSGGLSTAGIPVGSTSTFGLGAQAPDALRASRIIATAFGAGGQAFGGERGGLFSSILLGGVSREARKTGDDPKQILAQAFSGAFGGDFLAALKAVSQELKGFRAKDEAFTVTQFGKGAPNFGLNYQNILDAQDRTARGALVIPGGPAQKASRSAVETAIGEGLKAGGDDQAFRLSLASAVEAAFVKGATAAIRHSSLGEAFASFFTVDKADRPALRRAQRGGDAAAEIELRAASLTKKVDNFAAIANLSAFAAALKTLRDQDFRIAATTALATGDTAAVQGTITARLKPYTDRADAVTALQANVRERAAIGLAGPGFAGQQAAITELTTKRKEAEQQYELGKKLYGPATKPGEQDQAIADLQKFADARLKELEAELDLQRQIVTTLEQSTKAFGDLRDQARGTLGIFDSAAAVTERITTAQKDAAVIAKTSGTNADPVALAKYQQSLGEAIGATSQRYGVFKAASEGFGQLSDQLDLTLHGPSAARRQLATRRTEVAGLLPTALGGGAGAEAAIARLQRLLPEMLQLAQGLGGSAARRTEREVLAEAKQLKISTGGAADVAKDQLTALEKLATEATGATHAALADANVALAGLKGDLESFTATVTPAIDYLKATTGKTLSEQLQSVADLLGDAGPIHTILATIAEKFGLTTPTPTPRPETAARVSTATRGLETTVAAGQALQDTDRATWTKAVLPGILTAFTAEVDTALKAGHVLASDPIHKELAKLRSEASTLATKRHITDADLRKLWADVAAVDIWFAAQPEGRAMGGPVVPGKPYLVHRDELIVPHTAATVLPAGSFRAEGEGYAIAPAAQRLLGTAPMQKRADLFSIVLRTEGLGPRLPAAGGDRVGQASRLAARPLPSARDGGFTLSDGLAYLHSNELVIPQAQRAQLVPLSDARAQTAPAVERPILVNFHAGAFQLQFPAGTTKAEASELGRSFGNGLHAQIMSVVTRHQTANRRVA